MRRIKKLNGSGLCDFEKMHLEMSKESLRVFKTGGCGLGFAARSVIEGIIVPR